MPPPYYTPLAVGGQGMPPPFSLVPVVQGVLPLAGMKPPLSPLSPPLPPPLAQQGRLLLLALALALVLVGQLGANGVAGRKPP